MDKLQAGATGTIVAGRDESLKIHVGSSMMRPPAVQSLLSPITGSVITAEDLQKLKKPKADSAVYQLKDWLSDVPSDTDDEHEEEARRALIEALKKAPAPKDQGQPDDDKISDLSRPAQTVAELKTEKSRREERLRQLEQEAAQARKSAERTSELGRMYEDEGAVMEEAERNLQTAKAAPDALTVLAELNKKKELKSVDHSKIDYMPFQKNLYRVPRSLTDLGNDEVVNRRAKLKVRVRGHGAPAPVSTFAECGLSEKILDILTEQDIVTPFPVQAQCIPCIMAGRDVIGIAKTGSGKTLAYLLPMLRHILVQPPLGPLESGPIGLVLAPARELAYQIHLVCKGFAKHLGLK
jgi:ATP-dependent RNA helicase DDX46/PRP5